MKEKSMTIIIAVTLIILIVLVYKYSVPPKGDRIGPPVKNTTTLIIDSVSHSVTIDK